MHLPFATREEIDLSKVGDELIIKMGNFKKSLILPRAFAVLEPVGANLKDEELTIDFGGEHAPEHLIRPPARPRKLEAARAAPAQVPLLRLGRGSW